MALYTYTFIAKDTLFFLKEIVISQTEHALGNFLAMA